MKRKTVRKKILGITMNDLTPRQIKSFAYMWENGYSIEAMVERFRVEYRFLYRLADRLNLKQRKRNADRREYRDDPDSTFNVGNR